jgi:hypothetical protein
MKPIGTYKGVDAFELTRKEYIQERFYEDKTHYFVISDDGLVDRGSRWDLMVHKNTVVAAVKADRSYVDTDIQQRTYYTRPTTPKVAAAAVKSMKLGDKDWDAGSVETVVNASFDVDKYLAAAHSVDKYLEEMKNATYS